MRSPFKQQHHQNIFAVSIRRVPLNWLLLCIVSVVLILTVLTSTPPPLRQQEPEFKYQRYFSSPSFEDPVVLYRSFRRLRQKILSDWLDITLISGTRGRNKEVEICGDDKENFVPCYNVSANLLFGFHGGDEFDRHCSVHRDPSTVTRCLVRAPRDYKIPLQWPIGKDVIWRSNVNISQHHFFASSSSFTKRLLLTEDNQIAFNSEESRDSEDLKDYSDQIAEMMGLGSTAEFIKSGVISVLDIGCGFGSFGAHLISFGMMTTCIASYQEFDSPVQIALERGLPALIGNFNSRQLPYPEHSFDMIHSARCNISWGQKDGGLLIEVDRMLRPGGYFVLTSQQIRNLPGVVRSEDKAHLRKKNRVLFANIQRFAEEICWNVLGNFEETMVLQKTTDITCYSSRKEYSIPICKREQGSKVGGSYYYQSLKTCITTGHPDRWIPIQNKTNRRNKIQLGVQKLSSEFNEDDDLIEDSLVWEESLNKFWSLLTPLIFSDHPKRPTAEDPTPPLNMIRNVMDMNAKYGGLNAAFLKGRNSVWVMNVVSTANENAHTQLPFILDRGFTAVLHDWCEPFPTYPRTYDMLHAMGLFSSLVSTDKCSILDLFLEMDRILRPEGWVVLRDKTSVIENARAFAAQIHWETRIIQIQSNNNERLLICQKPFFHK